MHVFEISALPDKSLLKRLDYQKIVVIDVGATGGIESRWREIAQYCHFITFDPDPRASITIEEAKHTNFPIGLWSSKTTLPLSLTANEVSSSVFPFNEKGLSCFLNFSGHKILKVKNISVDSLENVLSKQSLLPDFIKVDAEGADLEILKGAQKYLAESCLGIQVEVTFFERHKNSPFFADIDIFLRQFGFCLMDLSREAWIRKNNFFSSNSKPQLIWANAVYMLSNERFIEKVRPLSLDLRECLFIKFLIILLVYRMHDTAEELRDIIFTNQLISSDLNNRAKSFIKKAIPSKITHISLLILAILYGLGMFLLFSFWKRKKENYKSYIAQKVKELSFAVSVSVQKWANSFAWADFS